MISRKKSFLIFNRRSQGFLSGDKKHKLELTSVKFIASHYARLGGGNGDINQCVEFVVRGKIDHEKAQKEFNERFNIIVQDGEYFSEPDPAKWYGMAGTIIFTRFEGVIINPGMDCIMEGK